MNTALNYFNNKIGIDPTHFKIWYDFEYPSGSSLINQAGTGYNATISKTSDFWNTYSVGTFNQNNVSVGETSYGNDFTVLINYWMDSVSATGNGSTLFCTKNGGSGLTIGINDNNKFYVESFGSSSSRMQTCPMTIAKKNAVAITKSDNVINFHHLNLLDYSITESATIVVDNSMNYNSNYLWLGGNPSNYSDQFNGKMLQFALYNQVLSNESIKSLSSGLLPGYSGINYQIADTYATTGVYGGSTTDFNVTEPVIDWLKDRYSGVSGTYSGFMTGQVVGAYAYFTGSTYTKDGFDLSMYEQVNDSVLINTPPPSTNFNYYYEITSKEDVEKSFYISSKFDYYDPAIQSSRFNILVGNNYTFEENDYAIDNLAFYGVAPSGTDYKMNGGTLVKKLPNPSNTSATGNVMLGVSYNTGLSTINDLNKGVKKLSLADKFTINEVSPVVLWPVYGSQSSAPSSVAFSGTYYTNTGVTEVIYDKHNSESWSVGSSGNSVNNSYATVNLYKGSSRYMYDTKRLKLETHYKETSSLDKIYNSSGLSLESLSQVYNNNNRRWNE